MKIRPNSRYAEFVREIGRSPFNPTPWKGVTFRSVELGFAKPEKVLSGEGSLRHGGRWNAPGIFPVIYSSTRPATAIEEALQLAADFDLRPDDIRPRVTCGIDWALSAVIDLTLKAIPSWLELAAWLKEDFGKINDGGAETLCQAFGRAARDCGVIGLFGPSVRVTRGVNLVVFRDRLGRGDRMRLLGKKELTKYLT